MLQHIQVGVFLFSEDEHNKETLNVDIEMSSALETWGVTTHTQTGCCSCLQSMAHSGPEPWVWPGPAATRRCWITVLENPLTASSLFLITCLSGQSASPAEMREKVCPLLLAYVAFLRQHVQHIYLTKKTNPSEGRRIGDPWLLTTPTARLCVRVASTFSFQTCGSTTKWCFQQEAVTRRIFSEGCKRQRLNMQLSEDLLSFFIFFFSLMKQGCTTAVPGLKQEL